MTFVWSAPTGLRSEPRQRKLPHVLPHFCNTPLPQPPVDRCPAADLASSSLSRPWWQQGDPAQHGSESPPQSYIQLQQQSSLIDSWGGKTKGKRTHHVLTKADISIC